MNNIKLCDGCNVRTPWEHKCHGPPFPIFCTINVISSNSPDSGSS